MFRNSRMWGVQIPEKRQIWHERGRQATDRAEIDVCESHGRQERHGNLPAPFRGPWGAQGPKKGPGASGPGPRAQFTLRDCAKRNLRLFLQHQAFLYQKPAALISRPG